jgi:hypothetical protein
MMMVVGGKEWGDEGETQRYSADTPPQAAASPHDGRDTNE